MAAGAVALAVDGDTRDPAPSASATPLVAPPCAPAATSTGPAAADTVAALLVDTDQLGTQQAMERRDSTAEAGPWTVTVRRPDGTLGRNGAVVTFPVDPPTPGRRVDVGSVAGVAESGAVVWPIAGAHARVRGDLPAPELVAVAAATTVTAARPVVAKVPGLQVVSAGSYRPTAIREARYGSDTVGEAATLGGGLTYTGVVTAGGGFEDQLYAQAGATVGEVHCRPAVMSPVRGGSATLAWEPLPGVVAYVGYSGGEPGDRAASALSRIAARTRVLSVAEWQALNPAVQKQSNGY